jgi:hypothetical protein
VFFATSVVKCLVIDGICCKALIYSKAVESGRYIRGPTAAQQHKARLNASVVARHMNFGLSDWLDYYYLPYAECVWPDGNILPYACRAGLPLGDRAAPQSRTTEAHKETALHVLLILSIVNKLHVRELFVYRKQHQHSVLGLRETLK